MANGLSSIVPMDDLVADELERREQKIVKLQEQLHVQALKHKDEIKRVEAKAQHERDWIIRSMTDMAKQQRWGFDGETRL